MNFKLPLLAYFVLFLNDVICQRADDDDRCITPSLGSGSCVGIYSCKPIVTFLKNAARPLSKANSDLLRQYRCRFQQDKVLVCCPGESSEIARLEGTSSDRSLGSTTEPNPPDVSSKANLRLLPEDCGHINIDTRIVNGNQTGLFEFPWMALISYRGRNGPEFRCGGTVINDRYILTAAHCISHLAAPLLGVRVGEHDLRTRPDCETVGNKITCAPTVQDVGIGSLIVHPLFSTTSLTYDIGLIRLARRLNFVDNVAAICLPVTQEVASYNFTKRNVIVTGFGVTETGKRSPTLLKVQLPYVERSECRRIHRNSAPINYRQLCAGGRNMRDSCKGDSGGPLQVPTTLHGEPRYVQQGIVSYGTKMCLEGKPGVYTRVAYYMDWILDNISS